MDQWVTNLVAKVLRSKAHTFERRRWEGVIVSRIDFDIACGGAERGGLATGWELSDHSAIGCLVAVANLEEVMGYRNVVYWLKVQLTVADEEEACYGGLVGDTSDEKLVDFRSRHLKRIRICA